MFLLLPITTIQSIAPSCCGEAGSTDATQTIVNDPYSEEQQGRNLAQAANDAGVECFVWSTLPSSKKLSGGEVETRIYEGLHRLFHGILVVSADA